MEEVSQKYILLQDRVGYTVERNIVSLVLPTKQSPTQVLRGELLEALPEAEQPTDASKIALVGIDRKSLRLECGMECITRLTEEDANLLLAISSLRERCETYMDKALLDFGRNIGTESKVFVTVKGVSRKLPGIVWYKGELLSCSGTRFGVELIVSIRFYMLKRLICEFDVPPIMMLTKVLTCVTASFCLWTNPSFPLLPVCREWHVHV